MLADFCKHRFLLSLSPAIPTQCGGVHKMKVTTQPVPLRPERAKALKYRAMYKAFALTIIFALGKIKR